MARGYKKIFIAQKLLDGPNVQPLGHILPIPAEELLPARQPKVADQDDKMMNGLLNELQQKT